VSPWWFFVNLLIEAYVTSPAEAVAAAAAGAGRIELCGPGEGGLTPTVEAITETLTRVTVPVHVMVRPREGDFRYTDAEFAAMLASVEAVRRSGAGGVVFGVLRDDGTLDVPRMQALIAAARPLRVVCHRAFDATPDADAALDALLLLGVDMVLTSGHAPTALAGAETLSRHVRRAAGRIVVMPGGNVRAHNVWEIVHRTGANEVHARATDLAVFGALGNAVRGGAPARPR
jgi:copper homeostasis protein